MGLTQVNMPDPNNQEMRVTFYDKTALERACLEEAHKRCTQAAKAPIFSFHSKKDCTVWV